MSDYIKKLVEEGLRSDGRGFEDFREIKIEKNVIKTAEGSARVKIGNSDVLVGIKLSVGEPFPDTPDEGILIVNTELVPVASPTFEPGPPNEEAIEISRVIDRGIRESHCIELSKLCMKEGKEVWLINIDIHVLDHDGNLIDAGALGAIAALLNTRLPKYEDGKVLYGEYTDNLPLKDIPIAVTIGKINNNLLIDPNLEEENTLDARITIATMENENLCAIQKGGKGYLTTSEIKKAVDLSIKKGKELRKLL
ncbi:MAG: exosome complex protein Rrp42 [Candidatus Aenigmatarchaeota archaeon]